MQSKCFDAIAIFTSATYRSSGFYVSFLSLSAPWVQNASLMPFLQARHMLAKVLKICTWHRSNSFEVLIKWITRSKYVWQILNFDRCEKFGLSKPDMWSLHLTSVIWNLTGQLTSGIFLKPKCYQPTKSELFFKNWVFF